MTTEPLSQEPIALRPPEGGALNWFDHQDENHRVRIEFFSDERFPSTPSRQEAWLLDNLRLAGEQRFFFRTLAVKGLRLEFEVLEEGSYYTVGTVPLAQLFLLPNQDPATELAQMKEFLAWVDERIKGQGRDGRDATIQWFRGGYASRGLEAAGFIDKALQKQLDEDLQAWREKPWFDAWYRLNMKNFSRVHTGPHSWLSLNSLVPCRFMARLRAEREAKNASARPSP